MSSKKNAKKEETVMSIESFKTPGMMDLMRRLYTVHVECGGALDERLDKLSELQKQKENEGHSDKRKDLFERIKVDIVNKIEETKSQIEARDSKGNNDPHLNQAIRKNISSIEKMEKELEKLQASAKKGTGIWKKKMDPKVLKERDEDLDLVRKHVKFIKQLNRKKFGVKQPKGRKAVVKQTNFDTMEDESKYNEPPKIDISEGLRQIEENKRIIEDGLLEIEKEVDKLGQKAKDIGSELDIQARLLDKIERDVEKYNNKLEKMNMQLDVALNRLGGPLRMVVIIIGLVVLLFVVGAAYVLIETYVKN